MSDALDQVAELVRRETGVLVKPAQRPALAAAIGRVLPGGGAREFLGQVGEGHPGAALFRRLVDEVTVQETYFMRELPDLKAIRWRRLLDESRRRGAGSVRAWVTACATGEEAYTLAVLAREELGPEASAVTILGTDVSEAAVRRAARGGGYSRRSVANLPAPLRDRYLVEEDGGYRVRDSLRSMVKFRHHNLVADPSPPLGEVPFDLVTCRNVLIYFDPPTVARVLGALGAALRPDGRLLLGTADRLTASAIRARAPDGAPPVERRRPRGERRLRRPLGREPSPRRRAEDRIEDALLAAGEGELERALEIVAGLLEDEVARADAYFVKGLVEIEAGDPRQAVASLRRCLYLDPSFGLAAFQLGRAHDARGEGRAARRAYEQALRTLGPAEDRHRAILDKVDIGDVAAACAARLRAEGGEAA